MPLFGFFGVKVQNAAKIFLYWYESNPDAIALRLFSEDDLLGPTTNREEGSATRLLSASSPKLIIRA